MFIPLIVVGAGTYVGGLFRSYSVMDQVKNLMQEKRRSEVTMFDAGEEIDKGGYKRQVAQAFKDYKAAFPGAPLVKQLRIGQSLCVVGILAAIAGGII